MTWITKTIADLLSIGQLSEEKIKAQCNYIKIMKENLVFTIFRILFIVYIYMYVPSVV